MCDRDGERRNEDRLRDEAERRATRVRLDKLLARYDDRPFPPPPPPDTPIEAARLLGRIEAKYELIRRRRDTGR